MPFRLILLTVCALVSLSAFGQMNAPSQNSNGMPPGGPTKPDLTPDATGKLSQEQMRALTRVVAENYRDNYRKQRDYTYIDHETSHHLDGEGKVKSTERKTYEIMELYGEPVARL